MAKSKLQKDSKAIITPDGGWGWMIIVAAGLSNMCVLPVIQQFGLLFRDKFAQLGVSSSQTTTIINVNSAVTCCVGLANGPVFKTFSYRQVSVTGAIIVFCGLLMTIFSSNFITYLISISVLYGAGYGISSSANALALNTYWKERRRLATGLSWTATGLGPILSPIVITLLLGYYGDTGCLLLLTGFSLHAVACALLLQPVEWHTKKTDGKQNDEEKLLDEKLLSTSEKNGFKENGNFYFTQISKISNHSLFSSQYLYNEDDPINTGYEITDPGIPMMTRANDGYFSQSRQSKAPSRDGSNKNSRMNSKKPSMVNLLESKSRKSSTLYLNESKKNSSTNLGNLAQDRENLKPKRKTSITLDTKILESEIEDCPTLKAPQDLKADEMAAVENIDPEKAKSIADKAEKILVGSKSLKSFKMDTNNEEKYIKDNQSRQSLKYGEKYVRDNHSNISSKHIEDNDEHKYMRNNHSNQSGKTKHRRKSNNFNYQNEVLKLASAKLEEYVKENEDKNKEKLLYLMTSDLEEDDVFQKEKEQETPAQVIKENLTFCQKIAIFFDLDLLKDFTYINLMLGITLANFNEINYSILCPFILGDLGYTKAEIATYMSLLAGVDISVRFCVPFIAGKIGWDNNTFFLFGVITMALGRIVLVFCNSFSVLLVVAVIVGFGKGFRTVFMALVIPTHVPLHKLPGASGLQLLTAGIIYFALGPVVGWIKDNTSTAVTLHCLNIFTWLTAISWGLEKYIRSKQQKSTEDLTA